MRAESRKERLWSRLVRPLLWPVLLAQSALLGLGLAVGLILWQSLPAQDAWGGLVWLVLALLLGTGLNTAIFLVQLRHRLTTQETGLKERLLEEQAWLDTALREARLPPLAEAPEDPRDHIEHLFQGMRRLAQRPPPAAPVVDEAGEALLREALAGHERRLDQLRVGHQRAREESRLKSSYLVHLRGELDALMQAMEQAYRDIDATGPSGQALLELRERLADLTVLLGTLAGDDADAEASAAVVPPSRPPRVLIVDDGPVNLMLARQVLEGRGVSVTTVTDGAAALECLEQDPPFDLVLMDIFMPDMDGIETSRRWREHEAARGDATPSVLVALTANAGEEDRRRFREAGMDDYLAKPYRPRVLLSLVQGWLPDRFAAGA